MYRPAYPRPHRRAARVDGRRRDDARPRSPLASPLGARRSSRSRLGARSTAGSTRPSCPTSSPPTSAEVLDRDGRLLRAYTVADGRWRLPRLARRGRPALSRHAGRLRGPPLPCATPASTRSRCSARRARRRGAGRVVSGGSTLTMQVARLLEDGGRPATLGGKLRQIRVALALERRLAKDEILELYLDAGALRRQPRGRARRLASPSSARSRAGSPRPRPRCSWPCRRRPRPAAPTATPRPRGPPATASSPAPARDGVLAPDEAAAAPHRAGPARRAGPSPRSPPHLADRAGAGALRAPAIAHHARRRPAGAARGRCAAERARGLGARHQRGDHRRRPPHRRDPRPGRRRRPPRPRPRRGFLDMTAARALARARR